VGPLDAFGHLINLVLPALGVAAVSALAAKLVWRSELGAVPFWPLTTAGFLAGLLAVLASLILFGRDGSMAGYALLVTACAISQWWRGFGPGRR
jgi:hypothetical protein